MWCDCTKTQYVAVTPRKRRVSRNNARVGEQKVHVVTPRKRRVSRNLDDVFTNDVKKSRLARGV